MKAASKKVLAVREVGVPLGLVASVSKTLVDPALEEKKAPQLVALGFEVARMREPILEAVVLVRPNVFDLERPCPTLGDQILKVR